MGGKNSFFMKPLERIGQSIGLVEDKTLRADPTMAGYGRLAAAGLAASATGSAPSIASMQYQKALQDAAIMGQAQAASARGVNPALAQRAAAQATQAAQADSAQQAAILEADERRKAQEILLGSAESQRTQAMQAKQAGQQRFVQTLSAAGQAATGGAR